MQDVTVEQIVAKALKDFRFFCKYCVRIKRKDGSVGPLILNREQQEFVSAVEEQVAAGKPVRIVVLKARQVGISTVIEARLLWRILRGDGAYKAFVLAHEKQAARRIFDIARFGVDSLPQWFSQLTGLEEEYHSKYELSFKHTGGGFFVTSADSKEPGRSGTIHLLHLSEAAYYDNADALTAPLMAALPKTSGVEVYVESTGNGVGGFFYDLFWGAWRGERDYKALFWPWYIHDEYRMPIPEHAEVEVPESYRPLLEAGKVTLEQLYWRQWVIANDYNGDARTFSQEFPATIEEAFIGKTRGVFDREKLMVMLNSCGPGLKGNLAMTKPKEPPKVLSFKAPKPQIIFVPHDNGYLEVWKPPEKGRVYLISADVAEGLEKGDASSADVIDCLDLEQVAHWWGKIDPDLFATELVRLGYYYNDALIAVESNNHGLTTLNALIHAGYPYLYRRKEFDKVENKMTLRLGWRTTTKTKPLMIDALAEHVREGTLRINSADTIREMLTFTRDSAGRMRGEGTNLDDRVMSLALGLAVWPEVPKPKPKAQKDEPAVPAPGVLGELLKREARGRKPRHQFLGDTF